MNTKRWTHSLFTRRHPLRVGTDCSGIEAPIVALQQLGIPYIHEFSSEIDSHCIKTIRANFSPRIIFGDMTKRKLKDIPDIDLYVCGFPCQPFSHAGKRDGVRDTRGTIFWECVRVIRSKRPMIYILENVPGLLSIEKGETFRLMIDALQKIRGYEVSWKVLNTKDYGIPQSRKRVFIVGISKKHKRSSFEWPSAIPHPPLEDFIDWKDDVPHPKLTPRMKQYLSRLPAQSIFVNMSFFNDPNTNSHIVCPTITSSCNLWCVPCRRYANVKEYLRLQGFPATFKTVCSAHRMKKQIGNSISVNVLCNLIVALIKTLD